MVAKRIIPCLDIKGGRTVKGINFLNLRDAGDPLENAQQYCQEGADELVFLDISATDEERGTTLQVVRGVASVLDIPFTVGGGVTSIGDVSRLLDAGADKVSVNSAAIKNPLLIDALAKEFGSQCIVIAIDSKESSIGHEVFIQAGKTATARRTIDWVREAAGRGAGEVLLTSMDHDGVGEGFAVELTREVSRAVSIPVIASGGAGGTEHFLPILTEGEADAALAASIFHERRVAISDLKTILLRSGIEIRT